MIFGNFNFKTTLLLKSCSLFDEATKLCKTTKDVFNRGGLLILQDLLEELVTEGLTSNSHDSTYEFWSSMFWQYLGYCSSCKLKKGIPKYIKELVWWDVKLQFLKRDLLSVVLPWSTCPIVPTLTFGLAAYEKSNRLINGT